MIENMNNKKLTIWLFQSKTYTEDANRILRSHYHKYFKNCQRDASPVLCRSLVEKDLFSLCLVIEGFWIIFLVKKFTIVFFEMFSTLKDYVTAVAAALTHAARILASLK